uniref:C2 domain-containing protein n=1 Tax=Mycena chlorophos TaxID=658473 RepID=A0ABQ0KUE3_MYCCL|nr:predicted protein [Mycena chlorophos]
MESSSSSTNTKRIQFHIDAATALPLTKNTNRPFVTVKIDDTAPQQLRTSTTRCDRAQDPSWQQNLTVNTMSPTCQVTFEVMQRSPVWAPGKPSTLACTDAYPLSTLLDMQGGNTFDTNIELPLHPAATTPDGKAPESPARLSVNIRELTSRHTAEEAFRISLERRRSQDSAGDGAERRTPSPTRVAFAAAPV